MDIKQQLINFQSWQLDQGYLDIRKIKNGMVEDYLESLSQSSPKEEEKNWNCNNCEYVFNEYDAAIDRNGTERCPKCDFALGGIPQ